MSPVVDTNVVTETAHGWVRGERAHRTMWFGAIPYGHAPVGELRWRPPLRPRPWAGVRDASGGRACPQPTPPVSFASGVDLFAGLPRVSEDCLQLDVTLPAARGDAPWPVLIWFHGGSFLRGAASLPMWDARALAADGRIAVVMPNYRLGSLGFLDLGQGRRNAAVHDALAAARWVRENADAFGLDADRVTVGGSSAGAALAGVVAASPAAQVAVRGVIGQSGLGAATLTPEVAIAHRERYLEALDWSAPGRRPEDQPVDDLLRAQQEVIRTAETGPLTPVFAPVREPGVVEDRPGLGETRRPLRVLAGTTRDELLLYRRIAPGALPDGATDLRALARALLERPQDRWLDAAAQRGAAFAYRFDLPSGVPGLGACHGVDVPFVFGSPRSLGRFPPTPGRHRRRLARSVRASWGRFVADGRPGPVLGVSPPAWDAGSRLRLMIADEPRVIRGREDLA